MGQQSDSKKDLDFFIFLMGCFLGAIIEQLLSNLFKVGIIPQKILIISLVLIIAFLVFFLKKINKKIQQNLNLLIRKTLEKSTLEIPCTFIKAPEEHLGKIVNYIKLAKNNIMIYSHLSDDKETYLNEHKNYIEALNHILEKKTNIEFLRIVVPQFDTTGMSNEEIKK